MTRTSGSSSGCDAVITANVVGGNGGSAGFPSNGLPYHTINIGSGIASYGVDVATHVITHELGHCIGFRHTDYFDRSISCGRGGNEGQAGVGAVHISNTPTGATMNGSVMNACFNTGSTGVWTSSDINALNSLYAPLPDFSPDQYGYRSAGGIDRGYAHFRQLADVNGDGHDDYCRFVGDSPNVFLACDLGTASGFSSNRFNSIQGIDQGYAHFRQLADVNGDGRADYCRFVGSSPNVFLSCNLAGTSSFSTSQYNYNSVRGIDQGYNDFRQLADVNGDSRADYCRFVGDSPNIFLSCNLAGPSGFSNSQYGYNSIQGIDRGYGHFRQLADVDGDGRADYCRFVGNSPRVFLSCNLADATAFATSQYGYNSIRGLDQGYGTIRQLADVNGDDQADYCRFVGNEPNVFLSCNLAH